jgi:hypothetical protein
MRPSFLVLAVVMAGCSLIGLEHDDPPPVVPLGEPDGIMVVDLAAPADASAITVEESIREHLGGDTVAVRGALFIDDTYGTAWLCNEIIPAGPAPVPSCARPALLLRHPDAGGLPVSQVIEDLVEAATVGEIHQVDAVRWSEESTYRGTIIDPLAESS